MPPSSNPACTQHPSEFLFNTPERWFHKQPNSAHFHASKEFWFHSETLVYRLVSIHKGINPNSPPSITLPAYLFLPQGKSSLQLPRIPPFSVSETASGHPEQESDSVHSQLNSILPKLTRENVILDLPSWQITIPSHPTQALKKSDHRSLFGSQN